LVTIPIALAGGIVGLQLSHNTLNIYSMIAMIMLVGLAGKNAVLIVDRAIHLQRHGMAAKGAALQAAVERSRAVLLTAASTIAGAAPLCVNWGEGAELRLPMGFCIVGGMVSSTILSLIVVPVAFRLLAGWRPMQVGEQVEVAPCRGLPAKDSAQFEEEQLIAAC
jgi:multidrug efflux pump subunit AcrB